MDNWYLVYCRPKQELRAQQHLANMGFSSYVPTVMVKKQKASQWVTAKELLFPRYLFLNANHTGDLSRVKNTRGVTDFVRFGGKIAQIPAELIRHLTHQQINIEQQDNAKHHLQAGDVVTISQGPYAGLDALFSSPDGDERSVVLINLLHQQVPLTISNAAFSKSDLAMN